MISTNRDGSVAVVVEQVVAAGAATQRRVAGEMSGSLDAELTRHNVPPLAPPQDSRTIAFRGKEEGHVVASDLHEES